MANRLPFREVGTDESDDFRDRASNPTETVTKEGESLPAQDNSDASGAITTVKPKTPEVPKFNLEDLDLPFHAKSAQAAERQPFKEVTRSPFKEVTDLQPKSAPSPTTTSAKTPLSGGSAVKLFNEQFREYYREAKDAALTVGNFFTSIALVPLSADSMLLHKLAPRHPELNPSVDLLDSWQKKAEGAIYHNPTTPAGQTANKIIDAANTVVSGVGAAIGGKFHDGIMVLTNGVHKFYQAIGLDDSNTIYAPKNAEDIADIADVAANLVTQAKVYNAGFALAGKVLGSDKAAQAESSYVKKVNELKAQAAEQIKIKTAEKLANAVGDTKAVEEAGKVGVPTEDLPKQIIQDNVGQKAQAANGFANRGEVDKAVSYAKQAINNANALRNANPAIVDPLLKANGDWAGIPKEIKQRAVSEIISETHNQGTGSTIGLDGEDFSGKQAFAVSLSKNSEMVIPGDRITPEQVLEHQAKFADLYLANPNATTGTWKYDGKSYLDISAPFKSLDEAMIKAKEAGQTAIYDLKNGKELFVKDYNFQEKRMNGELPPIPVEKERFLESVKNERGTVDIGSVAGLIQRMNRRLQFTGELGDAYDILRMNKTADNMRINDFLDKSGITLSDEKQLNYDIEHGLPSLPELTAKRAALEQVRVEVNKLYEGLKKQGVPLDQSKWLPRIVLNKGGIFSRVKEGARNIVSSLRTSAPALKHRKFKILIDEQGKRQVVFIDKGEVTAWTKNKGTNLGKLKLPTVEALLDKDLKPYEGQKAKLERRLKGLERLGTQSSYSLNRFKFLQDKAATLAADLSKTANTYIADFGKQTRLDAKLESGFKDTLKELDMQSKAVGKDAATIQKNLFKLRSLVNDLDTKINRIKAWYNPNELNNKRFVDKSGKVWTIDEARVDEIEANTRTRYSPYAFRNLLVTYGELCQVSRNLEFLDQIKDNPYLAGVRVKPGTMDMPNGYSVPDVPQLKGYAYPDKISNALDFYFRKAIKSSSVDRAYDSINNIMIRSIFFNPFLHVPNITVNYVIQRGLRSWLDPTRPPVMKYFLEAAGDTLKMNETYIKETEAGLPARYAEQKLGSLKEILFKQSLLELENNSSELGKIAEALGTAPQRLIKNLYRLSSDITWATDDILTRMSIREYMDTHKGATYADALKNVQTHGLGVLADYRRYPSMFGSNLVADVLYNREVAMFMPYHYSMFKVIPNLVKGLLGPSSTGQQRLEALDKLAAFAVMGLVVYPAINDEIHRRIGKDYNLKPFGALALPTHAVRVAQGRETIGQAARGFITPVPGIARAVDIAQRGIKDPGDILKTPADLIAPVNYIERIRKGTLTKRDFFLNMAGIYKTGTPFKQALRTRLSKFPLPQPEGTQEKKWELSRQIRNAQDPLSTPEMKQKEAQLAQDTVREALKEQSITPEDAQSILKNMAKDPLLLAFIRPQVNFQWVVAHWGQADKDEQKSIIPFIAQKARIAMKHEPTLVGKQAIREEYIKILKEYQASQAAE